MKQEIFGVETLEKFLEPLLKGEYVVSVKETSPETFAVEWEVRKTYIAHDGSEHLDEAWMTEDGKLIQVQDLSEAHAKNILRMILRKRYQADAMLKMLADLMGPVDEDMDDSVPVEVEQRDPKAYLH